ncbi:MAG: DinB family protein [Microscillaceae bacterium]|nr:DinB family protein [Microscillaceae bacterium]
MKNYFVLTAFIILNSTIILAQNNTPQQTLLHQLIQQNQLTCSFALDQVEASNLDWKLNDSTASIGFIYKHIGEVMNLFGNFLEKPSAVPNTTMRQHDTGQGRDFIQSKQYIEQGFAMLQALVNEKTDEWWMLEIDTPFFGKVSKLRLFSHILYHNAHHAGQISLTLSKAQK